TPLRTLEVRSQTLALQFLAHTVQQEVAVDPFDRADVRRVAVGAADLQEKLLAVLDAAAIVRSVGHPLHGAMERGDERGHLLALLLGQVEAAGHVGRLAERRRLILAGVAQTDLVGAGRLYEIEQARAMRLPAELADAAVGHTIGAADRYF